MRLTSHTDYGLRVLLYLAVQDSQSSSAPEIARHYGISLHHLRKVVQALSQAGFINTTRGRGGGIVLAAPPSEIRLGAVVLALEPDMAIVECFQAGTSSCIISPACRLKAALADARAAFLDVLDQTTLADAVGSGQALRRLLAAQADPSAG